MNLLDCRVDEGNLFSEEKKILGNIQLYFTFINSKALSLFPSVFNSCPAVDNKLH